MYDARRTLGDGIFVQDHLTPLRSQLGYESRKLVRENKLVKTWIAGCKIFALMSYHGKDTKLQIKDMDDINNIRDGNLPVHKP